jgi:hypothetical protein
MGGIPRRRTAPQRCIDRKNSLVFLSFLSLFTLFTLAFFSLFVLLDRLFLEDSFRLPITGHPRERDLSSPCASFLTEASLIRPATRTVHDTPNGAGPRVPRVAFLGENILAVPFANTRIHIILSSAGLIRVIHAGLIPHRLLAILAHIFPDQRRARQHTLAASKPISN